ncbi:MAG: hypothetical protein ICV68_08005, partial [Pyrinomonadaceae bacterium]|nr:hypothetical protein [Pyrinomonadaceae bacterium]
PDLSGRAPSFGWPIKPAIIPYIFRASLCGSLNAASANASPREGLQAARLRRFTI